MHIAEVDEHLDYQKFWTFKPEVHDITIAAGHRFWQILEGLADSYPCGPCKPGARALAHGGHDTVSLLLGKKGAPVTPREFETLYNMVTEAHHLAHRKRCTGPSCSRKVKHTG